MKDEKELNGSYIDTPTIIELTVRGLEHKIITALTDRVSGINNAIKKRIPEVLAGLNLEKDIDEEIKHRIRQEIKHQVDMAVRYKEADRIAAMVSKLMEGTQ